MTGTLSRAAAARTGHDDALRLDLNRNVAEIMAARSNRGLIRRAKRPPITAPRTA
jgi:hypothetical protein